MTSCFVLRLFRKVESGPSKDQRVNKMSQISWQNPTRSQPRVSLHFLMSLLSSPCNWKHWLYFVPLEEACYFFQVNDDWHAKFWRQEKQCCLLWTIVGRKVKASWNNAVESTKHTGLLGVGRSWDTKVHTCNFQMIFWKRGPFVGSILRWLNTPLFYLFCLDHSPASLNKYISILTSRYSGRKRKGTFSKKELNAHCSQTMLACSLTFPSVVKVDSALPWGNRVTECSALDQQKWPHGRRQFRRRKKSSRTLFSRLE